MIKTLIIITLGLLLIGTFTVISFVEERIEKVDVNNEVYYGPVKPTDNESYFRKTGITKEIIE